MKFYRENETNWRLTTGCWFASIRVSREESDYRLGVRFFGVEASFSNCEYPEILFWPPIATKKNKYRDIITILGKR